MDENRLREQLSSRYQYRLDREIGRGGMATVYLAYDRQRDRQVAIKVLHEELSAVLGQERFRRETQITGQLTHPNILPVYDSGEVDDSLFLVMPYLAGGSLRTLIAQERQLVLEDAVRIATEIANALDYAHRQGVVHRDVKPENILFGDGHAFVTDFGIARAIDRAGQERITRSGVALGTPLYMSPEQAAADADIDGRSDIYSLGCCLYEMLVGSPPFSGPTSQVIIARHSLEQVPSLSIARQAVPEYVEATVLRALAKTPADRFRTAGDFANALNGRTSVTMPRMSGAITSIPPKRSRAKLITALAATVVIAATAGAWALRRPRPAAAGDVGLNPRHIAVMYFDDRSGGSLAYLAGGLTEELIRRLRDVHGLDVASVNGSRAFRDAPPDSVARALSTGTVVQGSVEAARGDSVRVTIRLVEGATGVDFKRASFTGAIGNPIRLRDDLADRAASFLRARLGDEVRLEAARAETANPGAWALVQRADLARTNAERLAAADSLPASTAQFAAADSMLTSAESLDPHWPQPIIARAALAYRQARLRDRSHAGEEIDLGLAHVERAIALDPRNADALELRGTLHYLRWLLSLEPDPTRTTALLANAETDLRSAVSIAPTNASAWSTLSHLEYQKPDLTEAKLAAQRAYEEDAFLTVAPDIVWRLYTTSYDLEDFAGAAQWCAEGRRRFPANARFVDCRIWLMTAPGARPDIPLAWRLVDSSAVRLPPDRRKVHRSEMEIVVAGAIARAASTDTANRAAFADSARRVIARARPTRSEDPSGDLVGDEAFVDVVLGDKTAAFQKLKEYFTINPSHRALLARGNSWWWRPLRDDPRFAELVGYKTQ